MKRFLEFNFNKQEKDFLAILFIFAADLVFFYPLLLGKMITAKGFIQADLLNFVFATRYFFGQSLHKGVFPFWSQLISLGFPLFAEAETAMLYPINFLCYSLLEPLLAFNINLIIHIFLGGCFTYLFCRQISKLSRLSSIFCASAFMFSGPVIVHILNTNALDIIIWLPLELFFIEKIFQKTKYWYFLGLVFVIGMGALAGHIEIYFYFQLVFGLYILGKCFFVKKKSFLRAFAPLFAFIFAGLVSFFICLPQFSSTLELLSFVDRGKHIEQTGTDPSLILNKYLQSFVAPWKFNFFKSLDNTPRFNVLLNYSYLGLLTLPLVFLGIYWSIKKKDNSLNLLILFFLVLILSLNQIFPLFMILLRWLPFMSIFRGNRFYVMTGMFLILLAGFGLDYLLSLVRKKGLKIAVGLTVVFVVFADLWWHNYQKLGVTESDDWLKLPETGKLIKPQLFYHRISAANPVTFQFTDDQAIQLAIKEFIPVSYNMVWEIARPEAFVGMYLLRNMSFGTQNPDMRFKIKADDSFEVSDNYIKMISLQGIKYLIKEMPVANSNLKLIKEIPLGVSITNNIIRSEEIEKLSFSKIYLYENTAVLPRAFITPQFLFTKATNEKKVFNLMLADDFDLRKTVLLEEEPQEKFDSKNVKGNVKFASYTPNEVVLETESDNDGWLVLTDTYYPGWQAFVDGKEIRIYRGDFVFRAIALPKGQHQIKFIFEPTYWRISWIVSLTTLSLLIIAGVAIKFLIPKYFYRRNY